MFFFNTFSLFSDNSSSRIELTSSNAHTTSPVSLSKIILSMPFLTSSKREALTTIKSFFKNFWRTAVLSISNCSPIKDFLLTSISSFERSLKIGNSLSIFSISLISFSTLKAGYIPPWERPSTIDCPPTADPPQVDLLVIEHPSTTNSLISTRPFSLNGKPCSRSSFPVSFKNPYIFSRDLPHSSSYFSESDLFIISSKFLDLFI